MKGTKYGYDSLIPVSKFEAFVRTRLSNLVDEPPEGVIWRGQTLLTKPSAVLWGISQAQKCDYAGFSRTDGGTWLVYADEPAVYAE